MFFIVFLIPLMDFGLEYCCVMCLLPLVVVAFFF